MIRLILGLFIGLFLIFPGIELLRWFATKLTGLYPDMTLTEACLGIIIILQSISIARTIRLPQIRLVQEPNAREAVPPALHPPQGSRRPAPGLAGRQVEPHPQANAVGASVPPVRVRRLTAPPRPSRWRNIDLDLDDTPPPPRRPQPRAPRGR